MNQIKKYIAKLAASIFVSAALIGGTHVMANETGDAANSESSEQRLSRMAAEKAVKASRVEALVQTWSHIGEYKETYFRLFMRYQIRNYQPSKRLIIMKLCVLSLLGRDQQPPVRV